MKTVKDLIEYLQQFNPNMPIAQKSIMLKDQYVADPLHVGSLMRLRKSEHPTYNNVLERGDKSDKIYLVFD